jgi:hypothetical protein
MACHIHPRNGLYPEIAVAANLTGALPQSDQQREPAERVKFLICEVTARHCTDELRERLRSVVLTGSLARDEGTFMRNGERSTLFGDAEFLLVFCERAALLSASSLSVLSNKIESSLLERRILCRISLSASHSDYLLKMRPHTFAYELRTCGQVIWGEPAILNLIPAFSPSDIPLEDAWRTLMNRTVEVVEALGGSAATPRTASPDVQYRAVKLYLDMATSFLLFQGAYEPTYRGREQRLRSLAMNEATQDGYLPFPLRGFSERVSACTQFKLGAAGPDDRRPKAEWSHTSQTFWEEMLEYARMLWRWELASLTGTRANSSDRELLRKWMRLQPMRQRLRGWAYVLRGCGWHRSWREWPRWVQRGWQASPRHWVYAAASELFFKLGDLIAPGQEPRNADVNIRELQSWLPLAGTHERGADVPAWQRLASGIAWNYHQFLEKTRA